MALHGEIAVNGTRLGSWQAVAQRDADLDTAGQVFTYQCDVHYKDETLSFTIRHAFDDGALVLAATVLATAMALLA